MPGEGEAFGGVEAGGEAGAHAWAAGYGDEVGFELVDWGLVGRGEGECPGWSWRVVAIGAGDGWKSTDGFVDEEGEVLLVGF